MKEPTRLVHSGRSAARFEGSVNPRIQKSSTLLLQTVEELYGNPKPTYGRLGLETHRVLEEGLRELEQAEHVFLTPNGLSACTLAIAAMCKSGDHVLVTDSCYGPTRRFCERFLNRMGITAEFYDPRLGNRIEDCFRDNTTVLFLESPGSLTFEVQDLTSICLAARNRGIATIVDNTWSAGVFLKPLQIGADISVQALTKYVIGHADGFAGCITTNSGSAARQIKSTVDDLGQSCSPDDAYAAQRGLRTLKTRLTQHESSAIAVATWLADHPFVHTVLHPALNSHPDHKLWSDQFTGSSGLFSIVLNPHDEAALGSFFSALELFGFGFSWGSFESLIIPCDPQLKRDHDTYLPSDRGALLRLHVGLEAVEDLIDDLDRAFTKMASH